MSAHKREVYVALIDKGYEVEFYAKSSWDELYEALQRYVVPRWSSVEFNAGRMPKDKKKAVHEYFSWCDEFLYYDRKVVRFPDKEEVMFDDKVSDVKSDR